MVSRCAQVAMQHLSIRPRRCRGQVMMCALTGETERTVSDRSASDTVLDRLPPFWKRRLDWRDWSVREDPTQDRALIAMSLAGAVLRSALRSRCVWVLMPHTSASDDTLVWINTLAAYATSVVLFVGYDRLPMWALQVHGDDGDDRHHRRDARQPRERQHRTSSTTSGRRSTRSRSSRSRQAALQTTARRGSRSALVLIVQQRHRGRSEFARWLLVVGTTIVVGTLIRLLTGLLHQRSQYERDAALARRGGRAPGAPDRRRAAAQPAAAEAAGDQGRRARRGLPARRRGRSRSAATSTTSSSCPAATGA